VYTIYGLGRSQLDVDVQVTAHVVAVASFPPKILSKKVLNKTDWGGGESYLSHTRHKPLILVPQRTRQEKQTRAREGGRQVREREQRYKQLPIPTNFRHFDFANRRDCVRVYL
jgi:hypothetical protein